MFATPGSAPQQAFAHDASGAAPDARARVMAMYAALYPATDPRLAPLRADLARRLRPALASAGVVYSAHEFDALVLAMARVALHWSAEELRRREGAEGRPEGTRAPGADESSSGQPPG